MEELYSKLYNKYQKLKAKKISNQEHLDDQQNSKFINYVSAAEGMIELLKNENERLHDQINELRAQEESRRLEVVDSADKIAECQSLLLEENLKRKELSDEVERIQYLLKQNQQDGNHQEHMKLSRSPLDDDRKRQRLEDHSEREPEDCIPDKVSSKSDGVPLYKVDNCGNALNTDSCHEVCLFQTLLECLVGLNFYYIKQKDVQQLSVVHDTSGYSFNLSWIKNQGSAEGTNNEILYQVCSLGTLERIAPEWMREDLMFTLGMCPLFFNRISKIINLHG